MSINIAIDGPAGAGKSTIAKSLAKSLGYIYVDTGALYRAVAFFMDKCGISADETDKIVATLESTTENFFSLRFIDGSQHVFAGDEDISDLIRTPEISMSASKVSAIPKVREFLFELQQKIARENNVIMDGRDIGTVVLPNADVKIFLTASAEIRAERRFKELVEKGLDVNLQTILDEIIKRDYDDSHREIAPLKQADDAILLDSSYLNLDEVVAKMTEIIEKSIG